MIQLATSPSNMRAKVALAVLLVTFAATACDGSSGDSDSTSPSIPKTTDAASTPTPSGPDATPPPPSADGAAATLAFLESDGSPLLTMHAVASDWDDGASVDDCNALGEQLDRDVPSDQAILLIAGVEDEPLQAMLDSERLALHASLTACLDHTSLPPADELAPPHEIALMVQKRLDELKAAR